MAATVTDSVEDPKCPASARALTVSERHGAATKLCKSPAQKQCASRVDDDAEVIARSNPS